MRLTYVLLLVVLLIACLISTCESAIAPDELCTWVVNEGGGHKAVTVPDTRGFFHRFVNAQTTFTKPGLYAAEDIPKKSDIISIPGSTFLHVDAAHYVPEADLPLIDMQFDTLVALLRNNNVTDQYALLALRLAHERYKVENSLPSLFTPLIKSLLNTSVSPLADWSNSTSSKHSPLSLLSLSPASALTMAREQHREIQTSIFSLISALIDAGSYQDVDVDLAELLNTLAESKDGLSKEAAEQLLQSSRKNSNETGKISFPANPFTDLFAAAKSDSSSPLSGVAFTESLFTWAYNTVLASSMDIFPELNQEISPDSGFSTKTVSVDPVLCVVPFLNVINHSNPPFANADLHLVYTNTTSSSSSPSSSPSASASSSVSISASASKIALPTLILTARAPIPANTQVTVSFATYQHALRSHGYSLLSPHAFLVNTTNNNSLSSSSSVSVSSTRVCLPALPLANPTLLLLHGAVLPVNDHETVLLESGIPAEAWLDEPAHTHHANEGKSTSDDVKVKMETEEKETIDGKTGTGAAADGEKGAGTQGGEVVVDADLRAIISRNQLVPSALVSVAQPLLAPSNGRFLQALRARNLDEADKARIMKLNGVFSAKQGYFSLHNELQTMLELASSLEGLLNHPHQVGDVVSKAVPMVIGTPLNTDAPTFTALAKKHNEKVAAGGESSPESLQKLVALGYNIALKRVIYDTIRSSYEAISIMFTDLSQRWRKDWEIQSVDAQAWLKDLQAAGSSTDVAAKWVNDLIQWKTDIAKWETEAQEWKTQALQWKKAAHQINI